MKCHYEILEVARNADEDVIKKSYKKLVLKWHPDKNRDNAERCTEHFRLIQQAYEVLSDPREREFYDRHRESILKGANTDFEEKSVDLFPYFTASCYSGYGDDKNGFFGVYRKVFNMLVKEEYDPYNDNDTVYPDFGNSSSDIETIINEFYGFWGSFSTSRSFAWLDEYDISHASNRAEARAIDQENKKFRERGKAERNEQIRDLVAFVRKRDPRVKAYRKVLEAKNEETRKKQLENRKKMLAKNQEAANALLNDKEAEEARIAHLLEVSMKMAEDYDTCSDECDEEGDELPYCVVCSKSFKTINAKLNHENSKQHIKQLNELKKHMKEEDMTLFEEPNEQEADEKQQKKKKNKRKDRKKGNGIFGDDGENVEEEEVAEVVIEKPEAEPEAQEDVVDTPEEKVEVKKEKKKRRANKEARGMAATAADDEEKAAEPKSTACEKCKQVFESRTKLFAHLEQTGHSTLYTNKPSNQKRKNKKGQRGNDDDF